MYTDEKSPFNSATGSNRNVTVPSVLSASRSGSTGTDRSERSTPNVSVVSGVSLRLRLIATVVDVTFS